jgi:hypothetical protein
MAEMIKAYCMKTKEKNVPMQDAVITKTSRGGYMAQGNDGKGNKMTTMLGEAAALQAIKDGVAKQGW